MSFKEFLEEQKKKFVSKSDSAAELFKAEETLDDSIANLSKDQINKRMTLTDLKRNFVIVPTKANKPDSFVLVDYENAFNIIKLTLNSTTAKKHFNLSPVSVVSLLKKKGVLEVPFEKGKKYL